MLPLWTGISWVWFSFPFCSNRKALSLMPHTCCILPFPVLSDALHTLLLLLLGVWEGWYQQFTTVFSLFSATFRDMKLKRGTRRAHLIFGSYEISGLLVMCTTFWFNVYPVIKLFSFSSVFVERLSGLRGDLFKIWFVSQQYLFFPSFLKFLLSQSVSGIIPNFCETQNFLPYLSNLNYCPHKTQIALLGTCHW